MIDLYIAVRQAGLSGRDLLHLPADVFDCLSVIEKALKSGDNDHAQR